MRIIVDRLPDNAEECFLSEERPFGANINNRGCHIEGIRAKVELKPWGASIPRSSAQGIEHHYPLYVSPECVLYNGGECPYLTTKESTNK